MLILLIFNCIMLFTLFNWWLPMEQNHFELACRRVKSKEGAWKLNKCQKKYLASQMSPGMWWFYLLLNVILVVPKEFGHEGRGGGCVSSTGHTYGIGFCVVRLWTDIAGMKVYVKRVINWLHLMFRIKQVRLIVGSLPSSAEVSFFTYGGEWEDGGNEKTGEGSKLRRWWEDGDDTWH